MKIYKQISLVMADIEAIAKNRKNQAQGFMFRGIDDIYNELHSNLAKHGVFTVPEVLEMTREERQTKAGGSATCVILKIKYTFFAEDGSSVAATMIGEAVDSGDKASNKAQAIAHKYALLQVFAIPTLDDKDPDAETHEVAPKDPKDPKQKEPSKPAEKKPSDKKMESASDYVVPFGKMKGRTLGELGAAWISDTMKFVKEKAAQSFRDRDDTKQFMFWADAFLRMKPIDPLDAALDGNKPQPGEMIPVDWDNEPWPGDK